jgi:YbbR domain-containing protein
MVKKFGQKIVNNLGLKLLAILLAIVFWIVVVNIDDPTQTISYTTSVSLENTNYLTSMDKYYEVLGGSNTVSFRVTAKRSIQEKLYNSDFTAVANMEKIEYDERTETYQVPVTITAPQKYSKDVEIANKQYYIELSLEDLSKTQKIVSPATKGTVADGYALGDVNITSYNVMKISGPASIVSLIDTVSATINVDGVATDVTDSVTPVLYDSDGNTIDTTKLTLSLNTVTIKAEILSTKDVPLQFESTGNPADGYVVTGITYSPTEVRIKGESAVLNTVNFISVPKEVLDLSGLTENMQKEVDISAYLPADTALVLSSDSKVTVNVTVEPVVTKEFSVPVKNIMEENLADGYQLTYADSKVEITVTGTENQMKGLRAQDIKGALDLSDLDAGEYTLAVAWELSDAGYTVKAESVSVTLTEEQEENISE